MEVFSQLSSPVMYLICGGIVLFVAAVCVAFAVRAWRAGKAIGMDTAVLRRVVTSSASFSVLPAVGILLGVMGAVGGLYDGFKTLHRMMKADEEKPDFGYNHHD